MAKSTKSLSPVEHLAFFLGGIGPETAAQCPDFERRKLAAYGMTVAIPTIMGAFAAAYLASTLTADRWMIGGAGVLWAFFILLTDRAILSSYRAHGPVLQKASQFLLRATIAVVMGITVSHPAVLAMFRDSVAVYVASNHREHLRSEQERLGAEIQTTDETLTRGQETLAGLSGRLAEVVKPLEIPALPDASDSSAVKNQLGLLDAELSKQTEQRDKLSKEVSEWEARLQDEVGGKGISGKAGYGTESKRIEANELAWRRDQVKQIGAAMGLLNERRVAILKMQGEGDSKKKALLEQQMAAQQAALKQMMAGRETLAESTRAQIQATEANLASIRKQLDGLREAKTKLDGAAPPQDILAQTKALHSLFASEGGSMALAVYVLFSVLFVALDLIPLTKMLSKPGIYDLALQREEQAWKARTTPGSAFVPAQVDPRETEVEESGELDLEAHPLKVAVRLAAMRDSFASLGDLASHVGTSRATLSKYLKLANTPDDFREQLATIPNVGLEPAYMIASVDNDNHRRLLLDLYREKGWTVAQLRETIEQLRQFNEKVPLAN